MDIDRRKMPPIGADGKRHWDDDHDGVVMIKTASALVAGDDDDVDPREQAVAQALVLVYEKIHDEVQAALDRRDAAIEGLRREIKMLRDEVGVERGLTRLKTEVDEARQQARNHELESLQRELGTLRSEVELKLNLKSELAAARAEIEDLRQRAPSFEHQLNGLQGEIERVQKTTLRLRAEHSTLEYRQKQLDAEQQKNRREVSLTAVKMTAIGGQTREVLRHLHEAGFDLVGEIEPPSGLWRQ